MAGSPDTLGGYEIIREIARSNDIVYEARDPAINRRVAIKELALPQNLVGQERQERVERFYREARAAGSLTHPNIVTVFKVGVDNNRHYIAMEYLEGETLRNRLQIGGPLAFSQAVEICARICDALDYSHQHGVVHRDVKPDNIQILPDGTAKLTDFGIARLGSEPGITQAGQVFGTPSYMSPEQIAGRPVDRRTDIFAMGVLLYELLTGRKPFTGDSVVTITYNIVNLEPMPPPGVPPYIQQIIRRAMAKAPEQRYPTAADMARELRQPAPLNSPFPATQHVTALPRVSPLSPAPPASGGWPGPMTQPAAPGYQSPPTSAPGYQSSPARTGYQPAAAPSAPGYQPLAPYGAAAPRSPGGYTGGYTPAQTQYAPPGGAPPNGIPPPDPNMPPMPPLPSPVLSAGMKDFLVRQGPFLTLLGIVMVVLLIGLGVSWALMSGYQGFENTTVKTAVGESNDAAVAMLNRNDYADAYAKLKYALDNSPVSSPVHQRAERNMGVYWFERAIAAQQSGRLDDARQSYENALPLLPEKTDQINQSLQSLSSPNPGSPPVSAANAGVVAQPVAAPSTGAPSSGSAPPANTNPDTPPRTAAGTGTPAMTPASSGASGDTSANKQQSYQEYQAGLSALGQGQSQIAEQHFQNSVNLDPGAAWALDAEQRFNQLSGQSAPTP